MPTATFCSSEFAALGANERRALGMPGLPIVVVPHPVGGVPPEAAREMAEGTIAEVRRALTGEAEELRREYAAREYLPPRRAVRRKTLFT